MFHHAFTSDYESVRCEFVRKALKVQLMRVLSANFRKSSGIDLKEYISAKIARNEL